MPGDGVMGEPLMVAMPPGPTVALFAELLSVALETGEEAAMR